MPAILSKNKRPITRHPTSDWAERAGDSPWKDGAGLTLLEVMIAAALLTVGVLGLVGIVSSAMVVESVAKEHRLALDAAREVMARVKSEGYAALLNRTRDATAHPNTRAAWRLGRRAAPRLPDPPWYGDPLDPHQEGVQIDSEGNFEVACLQAWEDDPDGKAGKVTITRLAGDMLQINVTVRWQGTKGKGELVLPCHITDW